MELTNNQKKFLRKLAHDKNPVIMIGNNGLSEAVMEELQSTMEKHELLKIKIRVEKEEKQAIIDTILRKTGSNLIQVVGNIIVIYKPFAKLDDRQIILPRK